MTPLLKFSVFVIYLALSLFGLYHLKTAVAGLNAAYILGFLAYCAGFALWLLILKLYPLSFAFPVAAGALICGTQLIGLLLLREPFGPEKIAGSLMIVAGIALMSLREETLGNG